ncbi:MAG: hypothetical protein NC124_11830 [Clostridium sp.]|nr:hypothetical protein [Clostridium sp.]
MEKNHKNQLSTLLMAVGVFFIITACSIFVTTTWQYLPETAKQVCLFLTAGGAFAGSHLAKKSRHLHKTTSVLYYLGTAFAGFFTLSVLGGISSPTANALAAIFRQANAFNLLGALFVIFIFSLIRFLCTKKSIDLCMGVFITDSILLCIKTLPRSRWEFFALLIAGLTLILSVADFHISRKDGYDSRLPHTLLFLYCAHGIIGMLLAFLTGPAASGAFTEISVLTVLLLAISSAVTWHGRGHIAFRIVNSFIDFWLVYTVIYTLFWKLPSFTFNDEFYIGLTAYAVNLMILLVLKRREMFYLQLGAVLLASYHQLSLLWFFEEAQEYVLFFIPFAIVCFVLHRKTGEKRFRTGVIIALLELSTGLLFQFVSATGVFLALAIIFFTAAREVSNRIAKQILYTFSLLNTVFALFCSSWQYFKIPWQYMTDWCCLASGIGIALLGRIWYSNKKGIGIIQFILTCFVLLCQTGHSLFGEGDFGSILILGAAAAIILLVSACKGQRAYAILSSIVLLVLAVYTTRQFWIRIEWWVYLLIAGIIMIILAAKWES